MIKKVSLDLHDFSILRSRMDLLEQLHDHFPGFRVSLFTIPFDYQVEMTDVRVMRDEANGRIQKNLDWMQFIPHGLTHIPREFEKCDVFTMRDYLDNIESEFKKLGLPMTKGFCAPFWLWNKNVVDLLDKYKWFGAIDRNQPNMLSTKRYYKYTYSIDEPFWESEDEVLKLHGHMTKPSSNDLESNFLNLTKLPTDVEWHFITDFIEKKGD